MRRPDPHAAAEAPRSFASGGVLQLGSTIDAATAAELEQRGHAAVFPLGGCQVILIDRERGVLIGGSDPLKGGLASGY